jgi:hypothetical protein
VREAQLVGERDPVALAGAEGRRRPFADAVQGEDRRALERRGEEGARGVGLVVLGEDEPAAEPAAQAAAQLPRQVELGLEPERHRPAERGEAPRRVGEVGLEQALELQDRLVVEADVVELGGV